MDASADDRQQPDGLARILFEPDGLARILFVGDVVGPLGVSTVEALLPVLRVEHRVDFCVANGENAFSTGAGIDPSSAARLLAAGVDIITTGNHAYDAPGAPGLLAGHVPIVRPDNLPGPLDPAGASDTSDVSGPDPAGVSDTADVSGPDPAGVSDTADVSGPGRAAGQAAALIERDGLTLGVANVICSREGVVPYAASHHAERAVAELSSAADLILIDIHGSWPAEKLAIAWALDGRVCAVVGTHTHVPTADARVLAGGTAYISDVGMTGAADSLIGFHPPDMVRQARQADAPLPAPATAGDGVLMAVLITATIDGRAVAIEPVRRCVQSGSVSVRTGGDGTGSVTAGQPTGLGR